MYHGYKESFAGSGVFYTYDESFFSHLARFELLVPHHSEDRGIPRGTPRGTPWGTPHFPLPWGKCGPNLPQGAVLMAHPRD